DDDADDDSATISLTGSGFESGSVEVTVTDDDGTSGFNLSALWPAEGRGAAGWFAVELGDADRLANDKLTVLAPGALMPDGDDVMSEVLQFSDGGVSVAFGDSDVHSIQLGRPEDQPHRLSRDHHVNNLGIDHRRRQPATSA
ncbi:MAG: hypothetical protein ISN29_10550, partial [Gammaproteobacteria bacterium AqS3]|nr:hypothetical protein [Gammaproteobacteria bacterium AqS3]